MKRRKGAGEQQGLMSLRAQPCLDAPGSPAKVLSPGKRLERLQVAAKAIKEEDIQTEM
jgi:hypothetical protein